MDVASCAVRSLRTWAVARAVEGKGVVLHFVTVYWLLVMQVNPSIFSNHTEG